MPRENQKHLNLYIPNDLYTRVSQTGLSITSAVILGLEKLIESHVDTNTSTEENKPNSELVASLHERIDSLEKQLNTKDGQIGEKDIQISELTKAMNAQAIHLQTVLNQKVIEAPGAPRKWWQIWK
jgi:hypothetical protein